MLLGLVPVLAEPAEVNWPVLELIEKMETVELLKFVTYTNFPEGSMLTDEGLLVLKTPPVICARLPSDWIASVVIVLLAEVTSSRLTT